MRKSYDSRVPDFSNPNKRLNEACIEDIAVIVPVDETSFQRLELPILPFRISDVRYFPPQNGESWEMIVSRMLNSVGIDKVFLGYSLESALDMYKHWPNTLRIEEHGIVAIGLGERAWGV